MINAILRAPIGSGIFYKAIRLAEQRRVEAGYQNPASIVAPPGMLEQCKRISERLGIETEIIASPERWLRHHAGSGQGIVLVEGLYPVHYFRILQTLDKCPREYWLINPPFDSKINFTSRSVNKHLVLTHEKPLPVLLGN